MDVWGPRILGHSLDGLSCPFLILQAAVCPEALPCSCVRVDDPSQEWGTLQAPTSLVVMDRLGTEVQERVMGSSWALCSENSPFTWARALGPGVALAGIPPDVWDWPTPGSLSCGADRDTPDKPAPSEERNHLQGALAYPHPVGEGRAVRGAQFGWTRLTAPPPRFLPSSFSSQRAPGQNRGLSWEAWGLARNQMAAGGQVSWGFFRDTAGSSHAAKT